MDEVEKEVPSIVEGSTVEARYKGKVKVRARVRV
jgi:hypothetical protein